MLEDYVVPRLTEFLASRGLSLSEAKTRIVHINDGFNFLGFTVRRFPNGKLLTPPQKEKVIEHQRRLSAFLRAHRQLPTTEVIRALAPVIRGWCNYYLNLSTAVADAAEQRQNDVDRLPQRHRDVFP